MAAAEPAPRSDAAPWSAIAYALGALGLALVAVVPSMQLQHQPFPGFLSWDNGVLVSLHRTGWTGPRAGLPANGGILLRVDGAPFDDGRTLWEHARARPTGAPVRYEVADGQQRETFVVETMELGRLDYVATFGVYLLNGLALLTVGALALWLRPDLGATRALALATGVLGALLLLAVDYLTTFRLTAACRVAEGLAPAALVNLALAFPSERLTRGVRRAVVGTLALGGLLGAGLVSLRFDTDPELARSWAVLVYVGIALALLALVGNYAEVLLRSPRAARRGQAAVVFAGGFPAFALAGFGMLGFTLLGWSVSWSLVFALLPLAPISMLYAMVRQDLFDAERFVRLTAGYSMATVALLVAFAGGLSALDAVLVQDDTIEPGITFLFVLLIALFFDPLRVRVQALVDRLFYRSQAQPARELEGLSAELARLQSETEVAQHVSDRLREGLALESARVALGNGATEPAELGEPIVFDGERLGTILCGRKRSGAPFSPAERDLVRGMADQSALALHNARTIQSLSAAQASLRVSDRLASMGEFAGAIAHGLRNPLSGIRVATEVGEQARDIEETAKALGAIRAEVDRLDNRVRSLLQFARPRDPSKSDVDLAATIAAVAASVEPVAARQGVSVEIARPPTPVTARLDTSQLHEALLELATNALRAMPRGGRIGFACDTQDGQAVLRVWDTGDGIPEAEQERVFDLFYTTRRDGSGIGLASVKKIAESNGGLAALLSSGPTGTAFQLSFPLQ